MRLLSRVIPKPFTPDQRRLFAEDAKKYGVSEDVLMAEVSKAEQGEMWQNEMYNVMVDGRDQPVIHLSIRRLDRLPIRDWRDIQAIKNQLVGAEYEGVEIYPAESRVVDTANQFHLWVLADKSKVPFGFETGIKTDTGISTAVQRPRTSTSNPYYPLDMYLNSNTSRHSFMSDAEFELCEQALRDGFAVRHRDGKVTMTDKYYKTFGVERVLNGLVEVTSMIADQLEAIPDQYRVERGVDLDVDIIDPWVIIRNDREATNGVDVITAIVGTESMARTMCEVLKQRSA